MIRTVWPYLALMLLAAGVFPLLERRLRWRVFNLLPPIVLVYLSVTTLAVAGLWQVNEEVQAAQKVIIARLLPALLFLLMINCDLRAILRLGPRVLGVFFATTASLAVAFVLAFLVFRRLLPADTGWQPLAALSGSWMGGSANMVAVKEAIGMPDTGLAMSLLTDALCYSLWVAVLFSLARLAPAFNRWTGARGSGEIAASVQAPSAPVTPDAVLLWLGLSLAVSVAAAAMGARLPASGFVSATTWTIVIATVAGVAAAHTPLARFPGASQISGAILVFVVAVLASQSNFQGIAQAPLYILCGLTILLIHAGLLALLARLFRFDLHLCGISSLAHVGGVAAAPVLAAAYSPALVPVGILLALLGYILGTGFGLVMAKILSILATM